MIRGPASHLGGVIAADHRSVRKMVQRFHLGVYADEVVRDHRGQQGAGHARTAASAHLPAGIGQDGHVDGLSAYGLECKAAYARKYIGRATRADPAARFGPSR